MLTSPRRRPPEEALRRLRKELAEKPRGPLRIVIAGDPERPVRAIVMPRRLPAVVAAMAGALLVVAAGLGWTSWRMNASVHRLQGRVDAMTKVADEMARHPLPEDPRTGAAGGHDEQAGAQAADPPRRRTPSGREGRFTLESVNTGETVDVVIDAATGEPDERSYRELRHMLRCLRTGAETPIDPRLIELLHRIARRTRQRVQLVSGFRAPMFSTAALSYHTRGMAADIRVPGMTPLMLRDLVRALGVKGVGYYPVSKFVHVDVREERHHWTDYGRAREDQEGAEHQPGKNTTPIGD